MKFTEKQIEVARISYFEIQRGKMQPHNIETVGGDISRTPLQSFILFFRH